MTADTRTRVLCARTTVRPRVAAGRGRCEPCGAEVWISLATAKALPALGPHLIICTSCGADMLTPGNVSALVTTPQQRAEIEQVTGLTMEAAAAILGVPIHELTDA